MPEVTKIEPKGLAPVDEVLSFLGATSCRIVYRRQRSVVKDGSRRRVDHFDGGAVFVAEYAAGSPEPEVARIADTKTFAPLFSPDGRRIVYHESFKATDMFAMFVDDCDPVRIGHGAYPHWWVDPRTGDHSVVYRTESEAYRGLPNCKTLRQKIGPRNEPVGEPEEICPYGFAGGLTPDGRYLATAFITLAVADLETGEYKMPLEVFAGEVARVQTCCASVAPDSSRRTMQLRSPHAHFGICDFDGKVDIRIRCPEDTAEWQTPEWSTHPDFATVSALTSEANYDVYIVRLTDYETLRLTRDRGLVHAHMWVASRV